MPGDLRGSGSAMTNLAAIVAYGLAYPVCGQSRDVSEWRGRAGATERRREQRWLATGMLIAPWPAAGLLSVAWRATSGRTTGFGAGNVSLAIVSRNAVVATDGSTLSSVAKT